MKYLLIIILSFSSLAFKDSPLASKSTDNTVNALLQQYDIFVNDLLDQNQEMLQNTASLSVDIVLKSQGFRSFAATNQLAYDEENLLALENELNALSKQLKEISKEKEVANASIRKQIAERKARVPLSKEEIDNCATKMCCLKKYDLLYQDIKLDYFLSLLATENMACSTCLSVAINKLLVENKAYFTCTKSH
jgi:hypothetical protein